MYPLKVHILLYQPTTRNSKKFKFLHIIPNHNTASITPKYSPHSSILTKKKHLNFTITKTIPKNPPKITSKARRNLLLYRTKKGSQAKFVENPARTPASFYSLQKTIGWRREWPRLVVAARCGLPVQEVGQEIQKRCSARGKFECNN
jgi:hypothetical protein